LIFNLDNLIDDNSVKEDLNKLDNQITSFLIDKKYDITKIWKIIDNSENLNKIMAKINKYLENNDKAFLFFLFNLIKDYIAKRNESKNSNILKDNPRLDPLLFINEDLIRNIETLNLFSLQGEQSCGLFSLAIVKLLTSKNYIFEEIQEFKSY
jgi:hypothetical protein